MSASRQDGRRWLGWDADHVTRHAGTLYVKHAIKPRLGMGHPDPAAIEEAAAQFRRNVAVSLPTADAAAIPLHEFPELRRRHARLNEVEARREPYPAMADMAA